MYLKNYHKSVQSKKSENSPQKRSISRKQNRRKESQQSQIIQISNKSQKSDEILNQNTTQQFERNMQKSMVQQTAQSFIIGTEQPEQIASFNQMQNSTINNFDDSQFHIVQTKNSNIRYKDQQIESIDELQPQESPEHNVPIKLNSNKRQKFITVLFFLTILIIIIGLIVQFVIYGGDNKPKYKNCDGQNRDKYNDCKCKEKYYLLDGKKDCTGPYENTLLQIEDIEQSLIGQKSTLLPRIQKKEGVELFTYSIQNIQHQKIDDEIITKQTDILHNIGVLTTDITQETFKCILFFSNTTYTQENKVDFLDGFPGQSFWDNEFNNNNSRDNSNLEDSQNSEQRNDGEENLYEIQTLTEFQEMIRVKENISIERYQESMIPIIEFEISKETGSAINIRIPINFPQHLKEIITSFLNQYAPPLNPQFFSEITSTELDESEENSGKRRVLTETQEVKNSQTGYFEEENPEYKADVNKEDNTANLVKGYQSQSDSQNGNVVQQESKFNQATVMKQGQIEKSNVASEINLINPDLDEIDNSNYSDDYQFNPDEKPAQETQNLFQEMKVEQSSEMTKVAYEVIPNNFTQTMVQALEMNYLRVQTFEAFQKEMVEEKMFQNKQFEEIDNLEEENRNLVQNQQRILEEEMRELIKKITFKMFQFNLLGIQVKGFASFHCNEGPKGQDKDDCYVNPQFTMGETELPGKELNIKATISKYVRQYNWYRHHVFEKSMEIIEVLDNHVLFISQNATEVINEAKILLDPEQNPVITPLIETKDSFNNLIDSTYGEFNELIKQGLEIIDIDFQLPVKEVQDNIQLFVFDYLKKNDVLWENIDLDLLANLSEYSDFLNSTAEISSSICMFIDNTGEQFDNFANSKIEESKKLVDDMYLKKVVEPVNDFMKKLSFTDEDSLSLEELENDVKEQIKDPKIQMFSDIFQKLTNTLMTSFIQRPINKVLEEGENQIKTYQDILQTKVETITGQIQDKFTKLSEQCKEKQVQGLQLTHEIKTKTNSLLQLEKFTNPQELENDENLENSEEDDLENSKESDLIQQISPHFINFFKLIFEKKKTQVFELKNNFIQFGKTFSTDFKSGIQDLIGNVKDLTSNIKVILNDTTDKMKGKVDNLIESVKQVVPELKEVINKGNDDGEEYLDEAIDIQSIAGQLQSIKDMELPIKNTQRIVGQLMDVPEQFSKMDSWITSFSSNPFKNQEEKEFNLPQADFVDQKDISNVFGGIIGEAFTSIQQTLGEKLEVELKGQTIEGFKELIQLPQEEMLSKVKEFVFDELQDTDGIFQTELSKIMEKFQTEKKSILDQSAFGRLLTKTFNYPTPIGIPLFLEFSLNASVQVNVDYEIQDRDIKLIAKLDTQADVEAQGGISIYIAKAGAYVTAVLFNGILAVNVALGFASALYGLILVDATINAFEIKTGLFVQHMNFNKEEKCIDLGFYKTCIPWINFYWAEKIELVEPFTFGGISKYFEIFRFDI